MKASTLGPLALAAIAAACGTDGLSSGSNVTRNVGLTFSTKTTVATSAPLFRASAGASVLLASSAVVGDTLVVTTATDTMKITEILLTLEEIELERDGQTVDCSSDSSSESGSTSVSASFSRGSDDDGFDDSSDSRSDDDCEDHIGGPVLVNVHVDGSGSSQITVPAVLGTYDTLEFKFDVANEDDASHAAYRAAHPEMRNASARITGLFNGQPFVLLLDAELEYQVALTMPLVVSEGSTSFELAIQVDVPAWLTRPDGSLVNPNTICSLGTDCPDREMVEHNMDEAEVRADGRSR